MALRLGGSFRTTKPIHSSRSMGGAGIRYRGAAMRSPARRGAAPHSMRGSLGNRCGTLGATRRLADSR
jgi:hypothetical protein